MGCDFPIKAYRTDQTLPSGKRAITFNPLHGLNSASPFTIPCNNCVGCRLERSRQWSVRMIHESKLHNRNCFLTLTYDNQHVPESFGLDIRDFQLFMKRLRKHVGTRLSFFACGEYGDENYRPHFHTCIFGYDFEDRKPWKLNRGGDRIDLSPTLTEIWGKGFATVQDLTPGTAAYTARYSVKKVQNARKADFYYRPSPVNGVYYHVRPEFACMSKRPAIGKLFFEKFRSDFAYSGTVYSNGRLQAVPQYYLRQLTEEEREAIKRRVRRATLKNKPDQTTERRWARVAVRDDRVSRLKREL